jgi:FkbM family methyltransferase
MPPTPAVEIGRAEPPLDSVSADRHSPVVPAVARNLALGKPANQSSLSEWSRGGATELDAAGAVDGIITGKFQFHTAEEMNPWWCVDLMEVADIAEIRIFNRTGSESLAARLFPFSVLVSGDGVNWAEIYSQSDGSPPAAVDGKPLVVELSPDVRARHVKVQKRGYGFLHLDQVEVYGRRAPLGDNITVPVHAPSGAGQKQTALNTPTGTSLGLPFDLLKSLGRSPRSIIHIGAHSGQEVEAYKTYGFDWALLVEPLDAPFEALCKKIESIGNFIAIKGLCASIENRDYDFYVSSNEGASSSMLAPRRHLREHPEVKFNEVIRLRSTTADILCREVERTIPGFLASELDFMVLDTQGSELAVLKGAFRTLHSVRQIWIEVSHGGLYENDAELEELQGFLRCFGFRLYFTAINEHGYGDALFLRS